MAEKEIRTSNGAVMEHEAQALNSRVARQVSEILEEAGQRRKAPRPTVFYRVPAAGVRYYF